MYDDDRERFRRRQQDEALKREALEQAALDAFSNWVLGLLGPTVRAAVEGVWGWLKRLLS